MVAYSHKYFILTLERILGCTLLRIQSKKKTEAALHEDSGNSVLTSLLQQANGESLLYEKSLRLNRIQNRGFSAGSAPLQRRKERGVKMSTLGKRKVGIDGDRKAAVSTANNEKENMKAIRLSKENAAEGKNEDAGAKVGTPCQRKGEEDIISVNRGGARVVPCE